MGVKNQSKPFALYLLLMCLFLQALSGLFGGIALLLSPSGDLIQIPLWLLSQTPFKNFFIPGMILSLLLGFYPAVVFYGLISRAELKCLEIFNIYPEQKGAWTASLYIGIMLVLWIDFEIYFIGYVHYIQTAYALLGVLIIVLTLTPAVKKYYLIS
jgi:hypothetical protein